MDIANFGTSARGRPLIHKLLARASPNGEELTFSTRLLERRDQFLVFLREADGYPQMMRETVAAHRAHDYAYREQFVVDGAAVTVVGDDHDALGHSCQEAVPILAPEDRPGRIVWIIEKDDARVLVDGVCYAIEVEEKAVLHRNGLRRAAGGGARERIDREGMLRADRVEARA